MLSSMLVAMQWRCYGPKLWSHLIVPMAILCIYLHAKSNCTYILQMCCCKELLQVENMLFAVQSRGHLQKDCNKSIQKCNDKAPLIFEVQYSQKNQDGPEFVMVLWNMVEGKLLISRPSLDCCRMHHGRGRGPCPFCEDSEVDATINPEACMSFNLLSQQSAETT